MGRRPAGIRVECKAHSLFVQHSVDHARPIFAAVLQPQLVEINSNQIAAEAAFGGDRKLYLSSYAGKWVMTG